MEIQLIWVLILCILSFLLGRVKWRKINYKTTGFYMFVSVLLIVLLAFTLAGNNYINISVISPFIDTLLELLKLVLLILAFVVLSYTIIGFFGKKYSLRLIILTLVV